MTATARFALLSAFALHVACASEIPAELDEDTDSSAGSNGNAGSSSTAARGGTSSTRGGASATSGTSTGPQGGAGSPNGGATSAAGSNHGNGSGEAGASKGGNAGATNTGTGGAGGTASTAGSAGNAGQAGSPTATCTDATAVDLMTQYSSVGVASNACVKLAITSTQIKKVTMQPDSGSYPVPFSWSNCTTTGSGAFSANYANQALSPVSSQCPLFVKLGGTGDMLHFQWWGD